jgi:hypothetical protein
MKRLLVFVTIVSIVSLGYTPLVYADGPVLTSAKKAVQELSVTGVQPSAGTAVRAVAVQPGDSGNNRTKLWVGLALAGMLAVTMIAIDDGVEDTTPSSRRVRRDGCTLFCS